MNTQETLIKLNTKMLRERKKRINCKNCKNSSQRDFQKMFL